MIITDKEKLRKWLTEYGILRFKPEEFVCKHCGKLKIDTNLILMLNDLRHLYQKPIIITSAYRCPEYNKQIGGVASSAHLYGLAVDISVKSSSDRYELLRLNFEHKIGFNRIGIGKDFIHLDIDKSKIQNVIWTYYNKG